MSVDQKINEYKIEKQDQSVINQINKSFWTKIDSNGGNSLDEWAELYKKEKRTFLESIKMNFLEIKLSIFDKDFKKFKEELDNLRGWIQKDDNIESGEEESEDIDSILETSDIWKKIIQAAKDNLKNARTNLETKDRHCRWWANFIYEKAWLSTNSNKRKVIYQDGNKYEFVDTSWKKKAYQLNAIWEQLSNHELIKKVQPWDWLYVNNKNKYDKWWNHSVIFLWRKNWVVWQAETASYPGGTQDAVIKTYDLNLNPIKHITRPLSA